MIHRQYSVASFEVGWAARPTKKQSRTPVPGEDLKQSLQKSERFIHMGLGLYTLCS